ncbi:MAG: molybdate ABC transporter permease subunit [Chromatiaceae bacterium]|nr:molybdate ABC transporter permease subunit [Gammaproteobacteria bacterium]MCP5300413.1 molybdate ABC transporter permease subunit [Chromatiaceae bacterium]MCP5422485.1 molybdate ABC transporter permease subunit [Chromatiaceae bacterium]
MSAEGIAATDLQALWLTLRLAGLTTLLLILLGTPLAWWLARSPSRWRAPIEALVALPLVLPPTVLGFYLLLAMGPQGPLGGLSLAFTFGGLLLGSMVYSLPFVVQPLRDAFSAIGEQPLEMAACLGAGPIDRFFSVVIPLARPGYLTAAVLGFAHTLGEFGVVLMIGGNIPGQTRVVSIAVYEHVEALDYGHAHVLSAVLLLLSFLMLLLVYAGRTRRVRR